MGSDIAKLFMEMYVHVLVGVEDLRSSSEIVFFGKKCVFDIPELFLCFKLNYMLQNIYINFSITQALSQTRLITMRSQPNHTEVVLF